MAVTGAVGVAVARASTVGAAAVGVWPVRLSHTCHPNKKARIAPITATTAMTNVIRFSPIFSPSPL